MKKLAVFLLVIAAVGLCVYFTLSHFKSVRIDTYYDHRVAIKVNNFNSAIASFEKIFNNIFENSIDVNEAKNLIKNAAENPQDRDKYRNYLRMYTQPIFESLKSVGLSHMHYHFADGTSFLRMHRPELYGDDISFRSAVKKANESGELVKGFENGRHLLAYRFIFPLKMDGELIGSVELSIGVKELIESMSRVFDVGYAYVLEKDRVFANYTANSIADFEKHSISEDYILIRCSACDEHRENVCAEADISEELIKAVTHRNLTAVRNFETFAEVLSSRSNVVLTFLPIIDVNGTGMGYIISHEVVRGYAGIIKTYRALFITINIGMILIVAALFALESSRRKSAEMNSVLEKRVQEKVQELQDKEQFFAQQSKMVTMGEMLASILHQWKQPLSSISLISDMLLFECGKKEEDEELYRSLKIIKDQVYFMSETGEDFRQFMKPSKDKTVFSIAEAVNEVIDLFQFSFTRYGISFDKEWDDEDVSDAYIQGYKNEFKHVVLNIFNNARDAIVDMREAMVEKGGDVSEFEGSITVSVNLSDDYVELNIEDTGGGIPENIISRVFEKNFTTKDEQGSGIGLYMSKEMVEISMNGKISVKNIAGGARFSLRFPKAANIQK